MLSYHSLSQIFLKMKFFNKICGALFILISSLQLFSQGKKITNSSFAFIVCIFFICLNSLPKYQTSNLTLFTYPLLFLINNSLLFEKENNWNFIKIGIITSLVCIDIIKFLSTCIWGCLIIFLFKKDF